MLNNTLRHMKINERTHKNHIACKHHRPDIIFVFSIICNNNDVDKTDKYF